MSGIILTLEKLTFLPSTSLNPYVRMLHFFIIFIIVHVCTEILISTASPAMTYIRTKHQILYIICWHHSNFRKLTFQVICAPYADRSYLSYYKLDIKNLPCNKQCRLIYIQIITLVYTKMLLQHVSA